MKKHIWLHVLPVCMLALFPACLKANFTHNFHTKYVTDRTFVTIDATHYRCSADDPVIYTISASGADFLWDYAHRSGSYGATFSLNLLTSAGYVTTSPALNKLKKIIIYHTAELSSNNLTGKLSVQLSKDGSDWTTVTPTVTYSAGMVEVVAPAPDDYYIKIKSLSGTDISIQQINYEFGECGCFTYTPE